MPTLVDEMDALLNRAREGDNDAVARLLAGQQEAVRCFVSARFDRRLAARLDVEDVIQEVWVVVVRRLPKNKKDLLSQADRQQNCSTRVALQHHTYWKKQYVRNSFDCFCSHSPKKVRMRPVGLARLL